MFQSFHIIVIGGGLAGLTCALHLSIRGMDVLLIEKNEYPRHKVCGEYISNEVLPYLNRLGFNPFDFGATRISRLTLSTKGSRSVSIQLPLGGFGISRYRIDSELAGLAKAQGVKIIQATVQEVSFEDDQFEVITNQGERYHTRLVIGAFGKRSNLDMKMNRSFMNKSSPNLAVKAHYKGIFPEDIVGLHHFKGGYCGVSKVEDNHINVCYIEDLGTFKRYKSIPDFQNEILCKNKFLRRTLDQLEPVFEKPLTISNISFHQKSVVQDHILMAGDSAGMIHPLAGNGMGMAIRSAQMLSQLILKFSSGEITSRTELENSYTRLWHHEFRSRLKWGHVIRRSLDLGILSEFIVILLRRAPFILPYVIQKTHGEPMKPEL